MRAMAMLGVGVLIGALVGWVAASRTADPRGPSGGGAGVTTAGQAGAGDAGQSESTAGLASTPAVLAGRCVDETGQGVAGVRIHVRPVLADPADDSRRTHEPGAIRDDRTHVVQTDAEGRFVVRGLSDQRHRVWVAGSDHLFTPKTVPTLFSRGTAPRADLLLAVTRRARLVLTPTFPDGSVPESLLVLARGGDLPEERVLVWRREVGHLLMPPGSWELRPPGTTHRSFAPLRVAIDPAQPMPPHVVALAPKASVRIRVTSDPSLPRGLNGQVQAWRDHGIDLTVPGVLAGLPAHETAACRNGVAVFEDLKPGPYVFAAYDGDFQVHGPAKQLEVSRGLGVLELLAPSAPEAAILRVRPEVDGKPVDPATVAITCSTVSLEGGLQHLWTRGVAVDPEGNLVLVAAGGGAWSPGQRYRIEARGADGSMATKEIVWEAGLRVPLALLPPTRIRVGVFVPFPPLSMGPTEVRLVRRAARAPEAPHAVSPLDEPGDRLRKPLSMTQDVVVFDRVAPGDYEVTCGGGVVAGWNWRLQSRVTAVEARDRRVNLRLYEPLVSCTVLGGPTRGQTELTLGATLGVTEGPAEAPPVDLTIWGHLDADGELRLRGVPAGTYTVLIGGEPVLEAVRLEEGARIVLP